MVISNPADMEKAALFYASQGWRVFPIQPNNKIPYKDFHWDQEATTDPAKIKGWWKQWPGSNLAVATGATSGILVIDIDKDKGGEESWGMLILDYGAPDVTPVALTGGGGRHIIFKHGGREIRNSAGKLGEGIDVRGDGGYIVAPPSIHPNGTAYRWDNKPSLIKPIAVPDWLASKLAAPDTSPVRSEDSNQPIEEGSKIPKGQRNHAMTSIAGALRKHGATEESILNTLMVENSERCVPPLPDTELERIAKSVTRYEPQLEQKTIIKGRVEDIEWTWAASVYSSPGVAMDECGWLDPYLLQDTKIATFWELIKDGIEVIQAATDAGCLADLISMQMRAQPDRIRELATQIARYSYVEKLSFRIADLQHEIAGGEIEKARRIISEMAGIEPFSDRDPFSAAQVAAEFTADLGNLINRSIMTRLPPLDDSTGGMERQTLTVLAARPSMGKTTLAWQIARNAANQGYRVLFLSLEMNRKQLIAKSVCGRLGLRWRDLRSGKATKEEIELVRIEAGKFGEMYGKLLQIDDRPADTAQIWDMVSRNKPDFLVVDHLRLVRDFHLSEVQRLGKITQELKDIGKKFNCAILLLSQINRETEKAGRANKRPQMADLRDSGQIEENADNIWMMYREDYYDDTTDKKELAISKTEILIRKFRDDIRSQAAILRFITSSQHFE